jgi:hypothetical protein
MSESEPDISRKKSKYSAARHIGSIKIAKIQEQFLTVLKREAQRLLDESHKGPLSGESKKSLVNYIKLIQDLSKPCGVLRKENDDSEGKTSDPDVFEDMSDEELKQMAKKGENNV